MVAQGQERRKFGYQTDESYFGSPLQVTDEYEGGAVPDIYFGTDPVLSSYENLYRFNTADKGDTYGARELEKFKFRRKAEGILRDRDSAMRFGEARKELKGYQDLATPFRQEMEANRKSDREYRLQKEISDRGFDLQEDALKQKDKLRQFIMGLFGGGKTGQLGDYSSVKGFWG